MDLTKKPEPWRFWKNFLFSPLGSEVSEPQSGSEHAQKPLVSDREEKRNLANARRHGLKLQLQKKGYIRTLEAIIAIFITLFFVTFAISGRNPSDQRSENIKLLETLKENDNFRNCILTENVTCINATIRNNLENRFDFTFNISASPSTRVSLENQPVIFAEGIMTAGNSTSYNPKILRVFYWAKPPK